MPVITLTIRETEAGLFTEQQDLDNFAKAIVTEITNKNFLNLNDYFTTCEFFVKPNEIEVKFIGIYMNNDALNYVVRHFAGMLHEMGLSEVCYVYAASHQPNDNDIIIPLEKFRPSETKNSLLLSNLIEDKDIPETWLCQLSNHLMDEPVYTISRPDITYEKKHLIYWLYSKNQPKDPLTQIILDPIKDVIEDKLKKAEIDNFVKEQIKNGLLKKQQLFVSTVKKYVDENLTLQNITQTNIDKAFRNAAAKFDGDYIEDMNILSAKILSVDACDDNPHRKRNAMHWAILRNKTKTVEWLLKKNARIDITDASGKTARDYACQSDNPEIRSLILGEPKPQINSIQTNTLASFKHI